MRSRAGNRIGRFSATMVWIIKDTGSFNLSVSVVLGDRFTRTLVIFLVCKMAAVGQMSLAGMSTSRAQEMDPPSPFPGSLLEKYENIMKKNPKRPLFSSHWSEQIHMSISKPVTSKRLNPHYLREEGSGFNPNQDSVNKKKVCVWERQGNRCWQAIVSAY